jgi:hypothetical protein
MTDDDLAVLDPPRAARSKLPCILLVGCGSLVALVMLCLIGLGVGMQAGYLPDTAVQRGAEVSARIERRLREVGVLLEGEELLLFYSYGFFDPAEGGSALTSGAVVIWFEHEDAQGEYSIDRIPFADIEAARIDEDGGFLEDAYIEVETADMLYYAPVSNEKDGHELFLARLLAERRRSGAGAAAEQPDER